MLAVALSFGPASRGSSDKCGGPLPSTVEVLAVTHYIVRIAVTTLLIVLVSELSKRSSFVGAILASVPLVSVLGMIWLYADTQNASTVSALATSIFWLVLPSLALFIALPLLLGRGLNFYLSLGISIGVTILCYWALVTLLGRVGVRL